MKLTLLDILVGIGHENLQNYKVYVMGNPDCFIFNIEEMFGNTSTAIEIIYLNALQKTMIIKL